MVVSHIKTNTNADLSLLTRLDTHNFQVQHATILKDYIESIRLIQHSESKYLIHSPTDNNIIQFTREILFIFNKDFSFLYLDPVTLDHSAIYEKQLSKLFSSQTSKIIPNKWANENNNNEIASINKVFIR